MGNPQASTTKWILLGVACSTFFYRFIRATGSACAVLVSLGVAAIDENPFHVRINHQRLKYLEPFA